MPCSASTNLWTTSAFKVFRQLGFCHSHFDLLGFGRNVRPFTTMMLRLTSIAGLCLVFALAAARSAHAGMAYAQAGGRFSETESQPDTIVTDAFTAHTPEVTETNSLHDSYTSQAKVDGPSLRAGSYAYAGDQGEGVSANAIAKWTDVLSVEDTGSFFDSLFAGLTYARFRPIATGTGTNGSVAITVSAYDIDFQHEWVQQGEHEFGDSEEFTRLQPEIVVPIKWFNNGVIFETILDLLANAPNPAEVAALDFMHTVTLPPIFLGDESGNPIPELADYDLHIVGEDGYEYPVTLSATADPLVGDYNHNGTVDAADYVVWRDSLGQSGMGLAADGDDSEMIDAADYEIWKQHFGESASGGGSAAPVPEPTAAVALVLGVVAGAAFPCVSRAIRSTGTC